MRSATEGIGAATKYARRHPEHTNALAECKNHIAHPTNVLTQHKNIPTECTNAPARPIIVFAQQPKRLSGIQ